ncbi:MAG TPA: GGDEF domain-containing protein [Gaiellaceae bacterium]|nr:GGDEF domain-containing protein [Gaiellaceae bacterium]
MARLEGVVWKRREMDPLTHLPRRGWLYRDLERQLLKGREGDLFYIDLDDFARINDDYGFEIGDKTLRRVVRRIRRRSPWNAELYRIGGDVFAVLLRGGSGRRAAVVAERLRSQIAAATTSYDHTQPGEQHCSLTATVAVVHWDRNAMRTPESLLAAAVELVTRGKREGKNRVVQDRQPEGQEPFAKRNRRASDPIELGSSRPEVDILKA